MPLLEILATVLEVFITNVTRVEKQLATCSYISVSAIRE
jgi:hypothetical protein